jgi:hypothetical protein
MPAPRLARSARFTFSEVTAFLTLVLALVFVLAYQPLARRAELMDKPLRQAWEAFARTNQSSVATAGIPEDKLPAQLQVLEQAAADLDGVRRLAFNRIELSAPVLGHLQAPFQLIDFDNERLRVADEVVALAKSRKVQLQPAVTNGLPAYPSDSAPAFLWPRLHMAQHVLLIAIHCQLDAILDLNQLPAVSHRAPQDDHRIFEEMPMRVEVSGAVEPLARFLTSLPLRGGELDQTNLAGVLTNKPALFISRILLRKAAPDRPNDARLEIVVSGFVPATGSPRNR